ncbi:geranylgeranyl diphosphate synthase, type II [Brevibacterium sandarakinum]|uniref:Geranylgeranyl diphosphate synthase, type II n=1 Tax=Brevibacterium sandarakinum TaxID=629680 RepID=A0A1H1UUV1_BRESA|nr:polyprenyl synthetase family protein [Brevibacterium sandarakinum]SDS76354.1 geranylgeranyl diphosphate synthase, type II [Brevibacterium sandarakinum]
MTDSITPLDDIAFSFQDRLAQVLRDGRHRSRAASTQYRQLWESLTRMATGGKLIRPRLLMDAHRGLGGRDERAAVDAACAMQLLHIALVIHDDVIDNDTIRRGEANISGEFAAEAVLRGAARREAQAWGDATALLGGDLMLTLAHSLLARLDVDDAKRRAILDIFDDTLFESAAGEHSDVWLSLHLEEARSQDVLAMAGQKTAVYSFQAPLLIAAVLAGADTGLIDELTVIARQIGVIYQLRDDVLGLFGDERTIGKSTISDLREGKETLLIAFARSDPSWVAVRSLFGDRMLSTADGHRLRQVIEESGALVFVESIISDRCDDLYRLIREAALPTALSNQLIELTSECNSRTA